MENLKPNDIVRVVFGCCAYMRKSIGKVGTVVGSLGAIDGTASCLQCGYKASHSRCLIVSFPAEQCERQIWPRAWLVKIDPKADTRDREEMENDVLLTDPVARAVPSEEKRV